MHWRFYFIDNLFADCPTNMVQFVMMKMIMESEGLNYSILYMFVLRFLTDASETGRKRGDLMLAAFESLLGFHV